MSRCTSALAAAALLLGGCGAAGRAASGDALGKADGGGSAPSPADLVRAYPGVVKAIESGALVLADGRRFPLSDGRAKTPAERLADPDIRSMFADRYVPGPPAGPPGREADPGRVRFQPLFIALYGDCRKDQVRPKLRRVAWMPSRGGGSVMFTTAQGAADHLAAAIRDLEKLPASLTRYLVPSAGTYNCRPIAGTDQLSMHAFGAAIDINTQFSDYWRWSKGGAYRNRVPFEIAAVFERHGFIWGGKWGHFDTMHFEYRPELLPAGR